jgi:hypothetical protein
VADKVQAALAAAVADLTEAADGAGLIAIVVVKIKMA